MSIILITPPLKFEKFLGNLTELTSERSVHVGLPVHDCETHRNVARSDGGVNFDIPLSEL